MLSRGCTRNDHQPLRIFLAIFACVQDRSRTNAQPLCAIPMEAPSEFLELISRPCVGRSDKAAGWVKNDKGIVAVTCTDSLRTFPVVYTIQSVDTVAREFCPCTIRLEVIGASTNLLNRQCAAREAGYNLEGLSSRELTLPGMPGY